MESQIKKVPDKNYMISLLRFIAMCFIVLCHFFQYYGLELAWWFNVGVQMFFCISGFLYGNKKITAPIKFICNNFKKILIPYYCFLIPAIILYFIFHRELLSVGIVVGSLLTRETINGLQHLWFISYILLCYLITPILQLVADKMKALKWYMFLFAFFLMTVSVAVVSIIFNYSFAFFRLFCYVFGYFASVFLQNYKSKLFRVLTYILTFATILMTIIRIYGKYVLFVDSHIFNLFVECSHAFLGISIVLAFVASFKNMKRKTLLDLSDKYSFYIYIVHQLYILSPFNLLKLTGYTVLNWVVTILAILISAIILKFVADMVLKAFTHIIRWAKAKICI